MKRVLVMKELADDTMVVRFEDGKISSLSLDCPCIRSGSILTIDNKGTPGSGCVLVSVDGKLCKEKCSDPVIAEDNNTPWKQLSEQWMNQ